MPRCFPSFRGVSNAQQGSCFIRQIRHDHTTYHLHTHCAAINHPELWESKCISESISASLPLSVSVAVAIAVSASVSVSVAAALEMAKSSMLKARDKRICHSSKHHSLSNCDRAGAFRPLTVNWASQLGPQSQGGPSKLNTQIRNWARFGSAICLSLCLVCFASVWFGLVSQRCLLPISGVSGVCEVREVCGSRLSLDSGSKDVIIWLKGERQFYSINDLPNGSYLHLTS